MDTLSGYLDRFKKLLSSSGQGKKVVAESIKRNIGVILEEGNITITDNVVYLKLKPVVKNEVFIKKNRILIDLQKNAPELRIKDIRSF